MASLKWAAVLLAPFLTGCEAVNDTLAGDDGAAWSGGASLVGTVVLGGVAMFLVFRRRFRGYDLAETGTKPWAFFGGGRAGAVFVTSVVVAALIFAVHNWLLDMRPGQDWENIGAWCAAAALGVLGVLFGARELAHMQFRNSADATQGDG